MDAIVNIFPNSTLVDVLFYFLTHPKEEFYQAQIAKDLKSNLILVQRALKRLEAANLVDKTRRGNRAYYHARHEHPAFENLKQVLLKTVGFGDLFKSALGSLREKIHFCFIYGSVAKGKETETSDIDLFVVGDITLRQAAELLGPVQRTLNRECNISLYSINEFKTKIKEKNTFVTEVIHGPKTWLFGEERELKKMAARS